MSGQPTEVTRSRPTRVPFGLVLLVVGLAGVAVAHLISPGPSLPNALGYYALGFVGAWWGLRGRRT